MAVFLCVCVFVLVIHIGFSHIQHAVYTSSICVCVFLYKEIYPCTRICVWISCTPSGFGLQHPLVNASLSPSLSALAAACLSVSWDLQVHLCLSLPHGVISTCPLVPAVQTGSGSVSTLLGGGGIRSFILSSPPTPSRDVASADRVCGWTSF